MSEDPGVRIGRLAKALSRQQLRELLAIHELDLFASAAERLPWRTNPVNEPLLVDGLIKWTSAGRGLGYGRLTELGQHVMLCRVGYELDESDDFREALLNAGRDAAVRGTGYLVTDASGTRRLSPQLVEKTADEMLKDDREIST